jgi:hypothetical protein
VVAVVAATALATVYAIDRFDALRPSQHMAPVVDTRSDAFARLAPGETHDGTALAKDDVRAASNPSPLQLRRACAWGVPGRNPYRGTVAQATAAAKLPAAIAHEIEGRIERHAVTDRLYITRDAIRTVDESRSFSTKTMAMAFGTSLCFDTRVNFVPGHVEYADLYDTVDDYGVRFSVMVPDVCGNVAVLAERAEEWPAEERDGYDVGEPITIGIAIVGLGAAALALRLRH